jgi:biopolymer transport protein ExbD
MSKVKVKRKSTLIDMTAMSDVTVLLLTFFMLTATVVQKEPVKVEPPASVSEIKRPETNILQILVDEKGKVFIGMDNPNDREKLLRKIGKNQEIEFSKEEIAVFRTLNSFGVPFNKLKSFLALSDAEQARYNESSDAGIPIDSINNQFKSWVYELRVIKGAEQQGEPKHLTIAIKAAAKTPYPIIKKVMSSLQDINENRYNLITVLKTIDKNKE